MIGGGRVLRRASRLLVLAALALVWLQVAEPVAGGTPTPGMIYSGPTNRPWIALTFDADMTQAMRADVLAGVYAHFDRRIIAELRATNTPATIFLTGLFTQVYPEAAADIASDPLFEVENHTWDHAAFRAPCYGLPALTTRSARIQEIKKANTEIETVTGVTPHYFRFPGGCHNLADVNLVRSLGMVPVQWSLVSGDAFQKDPNVIIRRVENKVRNGSIIVMHLNGAPHAPATYDALLTVIPWLKAHGYQMVTLSDLLGG